jgi:glycosyltransferase involved in cell wall biosynthesis
VESFFELEEAVSSESLREMSGSSGRAFAAALSRLRNAALRRGDAVIAISAQIRARLERSGVPPVRIRDIPNAVDLQNFKPVSAEQKLELRRRHALPADRTIAVYAGRLSRAKGLPMLMAAWPALLERHPDLHLLIVGSGKLSFDDCEAEIKEIARAQRLEEQVYFAGESDRVHEYLQASDLFIFPTEYEGFSLALVEALGCGLPVVATAVGAAPELIQHGRNGFLFPPKDSAAMTAALESALRRRGDWPAIGAAARECVTVFDLAAVADRYLALCRELIRPAA